MTVDTNLRNAAANVARYFKSGTTHQEDGIYEIDVQNYCDPVRFDFEMEHIFHRTPLLGAVGNEISEHGSFKTIEIVGKPILLTRNKEGVAKAFLNVCRHRGAKLVSDGEGCAKRFVCPYHAWTYNTDGQLTAIAHAKLFGEVNLEDRGLIELPCEERAGLIWIIATPGIALDLDAHLGSFEKELALFDFSKAQRMCTQELPGGNWKLMVDTYLENYHLGILHRDTFAQVAAGDTANYERFGKHQRMIAAYKSVGQLEEPAKEWNLNDHFSLNYVVFPNTILLGAPQGFTLFYVLPGDSVEKSVTRIEHFVLEPIQTEEQQQGFDQWVGLIVAAVRDEDYWIQDTVQKNLKTGANTTFLFGKNEGGLHHFHRTVDEVCDAGVKRARSGL